MKRFDKYDRLKDEWGFTLVELLVVILIIGILAAVAIPAFLGQRQRANDASVESDAANLAKQIETELIGNPNVGSIAVATREGGTGNVLLASIGASSVTTPSRNYAQVTFDGVVVGQPVTLSDGVSIRGTGSAQGYTLHATHKNGKEFNLDSDTWLLYDSNNGGIQKEPVSLGGSGGPGADDESGDDTSGDDASNGADVGAYVAEANAWLQAVQAEFPGVDRIVYDYWGTFWAGDLQAGRDEFSFPAVNVNVEYFEWASDGSFRMEYFDSEGNYQEYRAN